MIRANQSDRIDAFHQGSYGDFYATFGYCTDEKAHLGDGSHDDCEIEYPLHLGAVDYRLGQPTGASTCMRLMTFPVTAEQGSVLIKIG